MKQLTIRGVSEDLARALQSEKQRRGQSLNQVVLDLLRLSVGLGASRYDNGLAQFAGTWSAQDVKNFEQQTAVFEQIDEELWK